MYRAQCIILGIQPIRDNHIRVILFSREYGRITCWYKKHGFPADLGDTVEALIDRVEGHNTIKNIAHKQQFWSLQHESYDQVISFMGVIKILRYLTGEHDQHVQIFDEYVTLTGQHRSIEKNNYLLFQIRLLKYLGFLDIQFFEKDSALQYMYAHITQIPLEHIITTKNIKSHHSDLLTASTLQAFHTLYAS